MDAVFTRYSACEEWFPWELARDSKGSGESSLGVEHLERKICVEVPRRSESVERTRGEESLLKTVEDR